VPAVSRQPREQEGISKVGLVTLTKQAAFIEAHLLWRVLTFDWRELFRPSGLKR